jgi:hypothetical protein
MKTIGQLIDVLQKQDPEVEVYFDFCNTFPGSVDSWRGIYEEAALSWGDSDSRENPPTVAELLFELERSINGEKFTGWKGGYFFYNEDTPLHIDNPGECTNTEIVDIVCDEYYIIIHTEKAE